MTWAMILILGLNVVSVEKFGSERLCAEAMDEVNAALQHQLDREAGDEDVGPFPSLVCVRISEEQ